MKISAKVSRRSDVIDEGEVAHRPNPVQRLLIDEFCQAELDAQAQYLREFFGLEDYNPQLTCNHSPYAIASYGGELTDGEPFVVLALRSINFRVGDVRDFIYEEYNFLAKKDGIGNGYGTWKKYCAWLIAHELAHTIVEIERFRLVAERKYDDDIVRDRRGHGKFWQAVYRELRTNFCSGDERFKVPLIDFSEYVYHIEEKRQGKRVFTLYNNQRPVGYFVREKGCIFKSNWKFTTRRATKHRTVKDVKTAVAKRLRLKVM